VRKKSSISSPRVRIPDPGPVVTPQFADAECGCGGRGAEGAGPALAGAKLKAKSAGCGRPASPGARAPSRGAGAGTALTWAPASRQLLKISQPQTQRDVSSRAMPRSREMGAGTLFLQPGRSLQTRQLGRREQTWGGSAGHRQRMRGLWPPAPRARLWEGPRRAACAPASTRSPDPPAVGGGGGWGVVRKEGERGGPAPRAFGVTRSQPGARDNRSRGAAVAI
jgi:hypothetical protein